VTFLGRFRLSAGRCPPGWKLTRAVSCGLDANIGWHLSGCPRCSAQYRMLRKLQHATANLPEPPMPAEVRKNLATRILAAPFSAPPPERHRATWFALTAFAALAITLASVWAARRVASSSNKLPVARAPSSRPSHASIRAIGAARFSRIQPPPNEVVRVDEGTVDLEVTPLSGADRFRVVTGDATIEVRGTAFEVSARAHELLAVHVWRGRVEVRSPSGAMNVLDAGDEWVSGSFRRPSDPTSAAPTAPASSALGSTRPVATRPLRAHTRAALALATSARSVRPRAADLAPPAGASFDAAWSLLRRGEARAAAAAFDAVARAPGERGVAEDALYWKSVALLRARDAPASRAALIDFTSRFPGSPRIGEASVMLGWSLLQSGDAQGARAVFGRALRDPSDVVRASAREGMARTDPTGAQPPAGAQD